MTSSPLRLFALTLFCACVALTGCTKAGKTSADLSGTGKKSAVTGEVTGFGSVFINGQEYATDRILIFVDGVPATEADLEVGMRVSLELDESGQPSALYFYSSVLGPITATDTPTGSFVVLGQRVYVDELTALVGLTAEQLADNLPVVVSGAERTDGSLLASFITTSSGNTPVQVIGVSSATDTANQQFRINELLVDYSQAATLDLPAGQLADDLRLRVRGSWEPDTQVLLAEAISNLTPITLEDGAAVEVSGLAQPIDEQRFQVEGRVIEVSAQTRWERGNPDDLVGDAYVDVLGQVIEGDLVAAEVVRFRPPVNVEVEGDLESIDPVNRSVALLGTVAATLAPEVRIRDTSQQGVRALGIDDLRIGDRVRISGFTLADDSIYASRLDRLDSADDAAVLLRGPLTRLDGNSGEFYIRDNLIRVVAETTYAGYADQADFFATAKAGDQVEVEGAYDASTPSVLAQSVAAIKSGNAAIPGDSNTGDQNDEPPPGSQPTDAGGDGDAPPTDEDPPAQGNDGANGQGDNPPAPGNDGNNGQGDNPPAPGNDGNNGQGDNPPAPGNDGNNGQGDNPPAPGNDGNNGQGDNPPAQGNDGNNGQGDNPPAPGNDGNNGRGNNGG